ncbi:hypothetical protein [Pseudomonas multiresinivorans]|uniref:Uncharacterized protein n=1 Tax=Pseudomonas multiresinivorans TaxID=95301 RepID=A0A7Z3BH35_9PSED|nr:hypothetical protein [Pseudomonas multiresinivorans]QJP06767.1 hypothetical protein G4G71_02320 [Pseudomonas multiresinivorans]
MHLKETDILGERIGEHGYCRSKRAVTQRFRGDIRRAVERFDGDLALLTDVLEHVDDDVGHAGLPVLRSSCYFGAAAPTTTSLHPLERCQGKADRQPRLQLKRHSPQGTAPLNSLCALRLPALASNRWTALTALCLARKP